MTTYVKGMVGSIARGRKMARKRKGSTPKVGQIVTLKAKKGQKKISFKKGSLHTRLGVPQGQKIPPAKMQSALNGDYGPLAKKEALFAKNVLTGKK